MSADKMPSKLFTSLRLISRLSRIFSYIISYQPPKPVARKKVTGFQIRALIIFRYRLSVIILSIHVIQSVHLLRTLDLVIPQKTFTTYLCNFTCSYQADCYRKFGDFFGIFRSGTDLIGTHLFVWATPLQPNLKSLRPSLRRFKSEWDEIWHDCSSSKYASIHELDFRLDVILSRWR